MVELLRVARFLAVGLMNTTFGYASYTVCILLSMPLWIALVVSMIAALMFNFVTYGGLVFKDLSRRNLPRFLVFYTGFAISNYSALRTLETFGIDPLIGQALLLPLLAIICYLGLRLFVFRTT
ncbi:MULTISPECIES: GtrA family protein [Agrobacterium]|uniref:GtrA family protein n=1 Tax=Agrobacterium TaxID=357 RepID=UPI001E2CF094|nr:MULTISPECIES: GtrA family protein [Agrobacterium]UHS58235.1 GtrA family protein [Agrobacterium vaccinii]